LLSLLTSQQQQEITTSRFFYFQSGDTTMKKTFLALLLVAGLTLPANADIGDVICTDVNFEEMFLQAFNPGTGDGISIDTDGTNFGLASDSAVTLVDLNGDGVDDIAVNMSYQLHQNGDSRIGFRANSANTALTMFSDSNTGTDFDYGFLELNWDISAITTNGDNWQITSLPGMTTSSLNGETELYEFGIIDTANAITAADIISYNADDYTGGDGTFSGATNSLGDASEILLPEHLGALAGVTYDAEATITGDLDNNPNANGNASDNITGSGQNLSLWYGGFDVGTDTNVGSPSGSLNWNGEIKLVSAVPEPSSAFALVGLGIAGLMKRRRP
jgi:hypothetical protein